MSNIVTTQYQSLPSTIYAHLLHDGFAGAEGAVGKVVDGDDYLARDGSDDGDALKIIVIGAYHFRIGLCQFGRAYIVAVGKAINAKAIGRTIVVDEVCAGIDAFGEKPSESGIVAAILIAESADWSHTAHHRVVGHVADGEAAFVVRSRRMDEDSLLGEREQAAAACGIPRRLRGQSAAEKELKRFSSNVLVITRAADLVEPVFGVVINWNHLKK